MFLRWGRTQEYVMHLILPLTYTSYMYIILWLGGWGAIVETISIDLMFKGTVSRDGFGF
jgi:hypothetical protein